MPAQHSPMLRGVIFPAAAAAAAALFGTVGGARVSKRRAQAQTGEKFIAGIPVHNYEMIGGESAMDWIVLLEDDATDSSIASLCTSPSFGKCLAVGHPSAGGIPFITLHATEGELEDMLAGHSSQVKLLEPDGKVFAIPELPGKQNEDIVSASRSWGLDRIGVPDSEMSGEGVHIYIVDTGIRVSHEDFGGRAIPTLDTTLQPAKVCSGDPECARDDVSGHGTHCAGTAAGTTYGVAQKATLHAVKVLADNGEGAFSWLVEGIDWVTANGVRPAIMSLSLTGMGSAATVTAAIDAATQAGIAVVVAAGNWETNACMFTPAGVESAITVGSINATDWRSSFSNFGRCTNIWAPGSDIPSTGHESDSDERLLSGTSMACPHVAGAAALLMEGDHTLSPADVLQTLQDGAVTDGISDMRFGDTNKLLYVGAGGPPPTPAPDPNAPTTTPWPDPCEEHLCPKTCAIIPNCVKMCCGCARCGGSIPQA